MNNAWRIIDTGMCGAAFNMALDEAIAIHVREEHALPTLRIYGWNHRSVSIGSFQKSADLRIGYCRDNGIPVVRRPTGGRAVLHGDELTYSFSVPTGKGAFSYGLLDSYKKISAALVSALLKAGFPPQSIMSGRRTKSGIRCLHSPHCFRSVSYGEIAVNGMKVIGSAQKRWKDGLLQQGSLLLSVDEDEVNAIFQRETVDLSGASLIGLKQVMPELSYNDLKNALQTAFEQTFQITLVNSLPTQSELAIAHDLDRIKYRADAWTFRR
jgi:lipoate-protein ligase A